MKLRDRIIIMLGLPLLCNLMTVGYLVWSMARIDEAAAKEAKAKKIIALCQESLGLFGALTYEVISQDFLLSGKKKRAKGLMTSIDEKLSVLDSLVKNDPKSQKVALSLARDVRRYMEEGLELRHSFDAKNMRLVFSQFLSEREFLESVKALWLKIHDELNEIIAIYAPTVQEFQPEQVKARARLNTAFLLVIGANILLVAVLAISANKNTINRLQILVDNMRSFSRGLQGYQPLTGQDELALLDTAFKQMADERNQLDEIRKSLQAMLSHDIRSPLSSIDLTVGFILDNYKDRLLPDVERRLGRMHSELRRLSRLVQTLLDVEKMESGHLNANISEHELVSIVEASITAVSSLLERKKIELLRDYDEGLIVQCDGDRTIQVLVNFLSNAIKFAPQKSAITIRCRCLPESKMRFEVIDQGPGVPADKVGKLFSKFGQLDQPSEIQKQGTGLGLFICKMLIEAQGGSIGYSPAPNSENGACFWFELVRQIESSELIEE